MRFLTMAAVGLSLIGGFLGLAGGSASATPISAGSASATAAAQAESPLATQVHWRRHWRHRHVRRPVYHRPAYYRRPAYYAPAYGRRVHRPRVVCRVRPRVVWTPYGYARRYVKACRRRW